jgi:RNA polymerase sigma-54 factor
VELNSDTLPRVLVDHRYYNEISALGGDEDTKTFMSECHANANWLVKSLDQRARTILKVSSEIVKQQDGFFAYGVDHMRPLNLKTVADAIEMHESTVSRVTSNKFMSTPRGMFELKYFFTASIPSIGGGEAHSAEAVRHKIKILISEEIEGDVKSDDKLVNLLRAQGIDIARRTVAKYRESMGIPSSVERRRVFKHAS